MNFVIQKMNKPVQIGRVTHRARGTIPNCAQPTPQPDVYQAMGIRRPTGDYCAAIDAYMNRKISVHQMFRVMDRR